MRRRHRPALCLSRRACSLPSPAPAQQPEDITFAYPNIALTFSAAYLAEDKGFFAKHGLRVKGLLISGPGATNAVIAGSADFALASTVVQTRAAAKGQRLLSIANPLDRPVVQIILRKDLAPNFDPKAPLNDRVRLLKDRTIAVDAIGSILHGFPLMLAKRAGLDTEDRPAHLADGAGGGARRVQDQADRRLRHVDAVADRAGARRRGGADRERRRTAIRPTWCRSAWRA